MKVSILMTKWLHRTSTKSCHAIFAVTVLSLGELRMVVVQVWRLELESDRFVDFVSLGLRADVEEWIASPL